jgi:thioredoxin 1
VSEPVHVTDGTFEQEVVNSESPVLVDFWAEWCAPCKMIAPVLEEIASEQGDNLKIAKMDVDANQVVAQQFGVMSIPTLILFKGGQPVERLVGYMPKENLERKLLAHIS